MPTGDRKDLRDAISWSIEQVRISEGATRLGTLSRAWMFVRGEARQPQAPYAVVFASPEDARAAQEADPDGFLVCDDASRWSCASPASIFDHQGAFTQGFVFGAGIGQPFLEYRDRAVCWHGSPPTDNGAQGAWVGVVAAAKAAARASVNVPTRGAHSLPVATAVYLEGARQGTLFFVQQGLLRKDLGAFFDRVRKLNLDYSGVVLVEGGAHYDLRSSVPPAERIKEILKEELDYLAYGPARTYGAARTACVA